MNAFAFAFALAAYVLTFLPGLLVLLGIGPLRRCLGSVGRLCCLAFPASLLLYVALYLALNVGVEQVLGVRLPDLAYTAAFVAVLALLVFAASRYLSRPARILRGTRRSPSPALGVLALGLATFVYVYAPTSDPLASFDQDALIARMKGAWRAHDNVFQYYNARAIAEHEPFEKYYGNRALIYQVHDREIGPGLVISVQRRIIGGLDPELADSFFAYTALGTAMQQTAIIPLFFLAALVLPRRLALLAALVPYVTPFGFLDGYYTWFKMAGASLTLSGTYVWLSRRRLLRDAQLVGLCWGLAINCHLSAAMFFPLGCAAALLQAGRRSAAPAACVTLWVLALSLPWTVVKRICLEENYTLFRDFFLLSQPKPTPDAGPVALTRAFFAAHPLTEQLPKRWSQVTEMLRPTELATLRPRYAAGGWREALRFFHDLEHAYLLMCWTPFLIAALLVLIPSRGRRKSLGAGLLGLGIVAGLTIVLVAYPTYPPDLTYTVPAAVTLLVMLGSTTLVLASSSRSAKAWLGAWLLASVARLITIGFH